MKSLKLIPGKLNLLRRSFSQVWSLLRIVPLWALLPLTIVAIPLIILLMVIVFLFLALFFLFAFLFYLISLRALRRIRRSDETIEGEYWVEPEDKP